MKQRNIASLGPAILASVSLVTPAMAVVNIGYWPYPTQSAALAGNTIGVANSANYFDGDYVGIPGMQTTDVGAYGMNSDSAYGTNDQGGNVSEWNDAIISGSARGLRGGSWFDADYGLASAYRFGANPLTEGGNIGFRVASVPEPSCVVLMLLASGMLLTRRKR